MKIITIIVAVSVAIPAAQSAQAQGTFQNLNFEQASPVIVLGSPYYPYEVTAASAFPDWTVTAGGVQQTQVAFNTETLGATAVDLLGAGFDPAPIDGNYSALLQGGVGPGAAAISQTGLIPSGTQSLLFEAQQQNPRLSAVPQVLQVQVASQIVPLTAMGTGPNYTLYGADISAWAGETEQITFSALSYSYANNWELDDITFSPQSVPEPSAIFLTGTGGLMLAVYRRFAGRR